MQGSSPNLVSHGYISFFYIHFSPTSLFYTVSLSLSPHSYKSISFTQLSPYNTLHRQQLLHLSLSLSPFYITHSLFTHSLIHSHTLLALLQLPHFSLSPALSTPVLHIALHSNLLHSSAQLLQARDVTLTGQ